MPGTATFDHYEVLTRDDGSPWELGRGAMGITYKAFDTNLRIPVALKVINTQKLDSESARQRFVREARSAAKLRHRHVASVFHLGSERDAYFYVMEFIDGETVEALVRRHGPLPPLVALRIALQVSRALSAAEQQGLVHRDIKPSNLMLLREDDELCAKVIDFGLATSRAAGDVEEEAKAQPAGGFVGTPQFASPEQLQQQESDVRSDIYSLGCTLWYMLKSEPPFTGSLAEVIGQHLQGAVPFEKLTAPEQVARLLARMLAKERASRHQSGAELRQELERCIEDLAGGPAAAAARVALEEESFASQWIRGGADQTGTIFTTGEILAGRYEILGRLAENNAGRFVHARDRSENRDVRLLVLQAELAADRSVCTQIEREVERIASAPHPHLLRVHSYETADDFGLISMEWTVGFTLLDLLRARRELQPDETLKLLEQMAAGADHALSAGLAKVVFALHEVFIHFPQLTESPAPLLDQPLDDWPAFQVKLNPLGVTRELSLSQTWAGGQTIVNDMASATPRDGEGNPRAAYVRALAGVTYETLGGSLSHFLTSDGGLHGAPRFTPLANLSEAGNEVLRRALDPARGFDSAGAFFAALNGVGDLETKRHEPKAAPRSSASGRDPAPAAAPSKGRSMAPFAAAALAVAALLGVAFVLLRKPQTPELPPSQTTASAPATPDERPAAPTPSATPPSAPTRQELLKAAAAKAQEVEAENDPARSISAWLQVAKDFPEAKIGKQQLELVLDQLRNRTEKLKPAEFDALRDGVAQAADQGVIGAMMLLGEMLREREPETAFQWYSAAADKGQPTALTQVGLMLSNGAGVQTDLKRAVEYFEAAANKGDAAAKAALGECFLSAKGVEKDEKRAIEYLREAADAGNLRALNRLGNCYHRGVGVNKDFAEAFRLFSQAAEGGLPEAIGNLGVLYIKGDGAPKDPQKAAELFHAGADKEDMMCMFYYAYCLETGTGLAKNDKEAAAWYEKAAAAGHPKAAEWCRQHGVPFNAR